MLFAHFLVHAIDALFAAGDLRRDIGELEPLADALQDAVHHLTPVTTRCLDRAGEYAIAHRIKMLEGQFLQLNEERVQPQSVGNRCIDVQRLARDPFTMRRCHGIERAHVVQSIGELDENDPHVLGHCQQHLAETLRLLVFA